MLKRAGKGHICCVANKHGAGKGAGVAKIALIRQTARTASELERAKLVLNDAQAPVLRVTRLRYDGEAQPLALEDLVLPLGRFPGLAHNGGDIPDIIELAQRCGLKLGLATEHISIVPATKEVASHLQIAVGADVMKLDRTTETADSEPVEWRVAFARKTD